MLITRKFLQSFFTMSAVFLLLACGGIFALMRIDFISSLNEALKAEAENVAVMAAHEYGMGDLVTLRSSLNWLAAGRTWTTAELVGKDGVTIWKYSALANTAKDFDLHTDQGNDGSAISVTVPVRDTYGASDIGAFVVRKDATVEARRFRSEVFSVMAGIILFWASFFCIIWYLTQRSFKPLKSMLDSVKARANKLALDLKVPEKSNDEVTLVAKWFEELAAAWEKAQTVAIANERVAAIASTTQSLAHDVRKPLSITKIGLGMLARVAKDPAKVQEVLNKLTPEITKAISSVDGMISDVLEISSNSDQLIQEPTTPQALLDSTLQEIFRVYPKADISITYDLQHTNAVNVHIQKVNRVLSNVYGNAVQAINCQGRTWFKTREQDGFIEFVIGNAGSFIPPESLAKLFEAFYTSGKKGGTGLGLAIAEKVVKAHGGKIWCVSGKNEQYPSGYVEFHFTLPTTVSNSLFTGTLPVHSSEIGRGLLALAEPETLTASASSTKDDLDLENQVLQASKVLGRKLQVLIVDDEEIYRAGLISTLTRTPELADILTITEVATSDKALGVAADQSLDLVVTDVDLGPQSAIDGFELVETLRSSFVASDHTCVISVHTNRIMPADQKTAIAKGADAFITKPVSRTQLLKLLLQTFKSIETSTVPVTVSAKTEEPKQRPLVAVLEDNIFMLEAWVETLAQDSEAIGFASPEDFIAKLDSDPSFLARLSVLVTDLNFENGSVFNGIDIAKLVKGKRADLTVLLSSDGGGKGTDLSGAIDHVIAKNASKFGALAQQCGISQKRTST